MKRCDFIRASVTATAAVGLGAALESWVPVHNWDGYDFGSGPQVPDRLYQGPLGCYHPDDFHGGWCFQSTQPGKQHYKVYKQDTELRTETHIRRLTDEERIREIAMLLSGSQVTPEALSNAKQLLGC